MYGLEDPLDSPDFDPIAFINQNFPTGRVTHPTRTFSKSLIVSRLFHFFSYLTISLYYLLHRIILGWAWHICRRYFVSNFYTRWGNFESCPSTEHGRKASIEGDRCNCRSCWCSFVSCLLMSHLILWRDGFFLVLYEALLLSLSLIILSSLLCWFM